MPLEGIQPADRLIPNNQLAEAKSLGAFDSKVESSSMVRKAGDDQASQGGYFLEEELEEQENQDETSVSAQQLSPDSDAGNQQSQEITRDPEFTIKFNKYTEQVELIKIANGDLVQTIPAEDLIKLISDLKYRSGMFFDSEL